MSYKRLLIFVLFMAAVERADARWYATQGTEGKRQGTWSAASGTRTSAPALGGTWTATADPTTGAVSGSWTLVDQKGKVVMQGAWSAVKSPTGWTGAWRAAVDRSKSEYSGTWRADLKMKADARFADLFAAAANAAVSGTWRAHRRSGRWSIRASE